MLNIQGNYVIINVNDNDSWRLHLVDANFMLSRYSGIGASIVKIIYTITHYKNENDNDITTEATPVAIGTIELIVNGKFYCKYSQDVSDNIDSMYYETIDGTPVTPPSSDACAFIVNPSNVTVSNDNQYFTLSVVSVENGKSINPTFSNYQGIERVGTSYKFKLTDSNSLPTTLIVSGACNKQSSITVNYDSGTSICSLFTIDKVGKLKEGSTTEYEFTEITDKSTYNFTFDNAETCILENNSIFNYKSNFAFIIGCNTSWKIKYDSPQNITNIRKNGNTLYLSLADYTERNNCQIILSDKCNNELTLQFNVVEGLIQEDEYKFYWDIEGEQSTTAEIESDNPVPVKLVSTYNTEDSSWFVQNNNSAISFYFYYNGEELEEYKFDKGIQINYANSKDEVPKDTTYIYIVPKTNLIQFSTYNTNITFIQFESNETITLNVKLKVPCKVSISGYVKKIN